jgi:hypothetical protein
MDPQAANSCTRSPGAAPALDGPFGAHGLGRIRIAGALRAFLRDSRGVPVYPAGD